MEIANYSTLHWRREKHKEYLKFKQDIHSKFINELNILDEILASIDAQCSCSQKAVKRYICLLIYRFTKIKRIIWKKKIC